MSILLNATKDADPLTQHLLAFIQAQLVADRLSAGDCAGAVGDLAGFVARYAMVLGRK